MILFKNAEYQSTEANVSGQKQQQNQTLIEGKLVYMTSASVQFVDAIH